MTSVPCYMPTIIFIMCVFVLGLVWEGLKFIRPILAWSVVILTVYIVVKPFFRQLSALRKRLEVQSRPETRDEPVPPIFVAPEADKGISNVNPRKSNSLPQLISSAEQYPEIQHIPESKNPIPYTILRYQVEQKPKPQNKSAPNNEESLLTLRHQFHTMLKREVERRQKACRTGQGHTSLDTPLAETANTFISEYERNFHKNRTGYVRTIIGSSYATPYEVNHDDPKLSGGVYLLRAGNYYKIGKANVFDKRISQIRLQLPYEIDVVHVIYSRNPYETERMWHERFADKRLNGEWFALSPFDVEEFTSQTIM
jgi:hypothetical protein